MSRDNRGRISARSIQAQNVVLGAQLNGAADAQLIMQVARRVRSGDIEADEIGAINVVSGLQLLNNPAPTAEQISDVLEKIRTGINEGKEVLASVPETDVEDLMREVKATQDELTKPDPSPGRVKRSVETINDTLSDCASAAENAGKLTTTLSGLALQAALLWQSVQHFFS
jgi:hypothetical protein